MFWWSLDAATVAVMCGLAESSWQPEDLDATWARTGWPTPGDEPISRLVFERWDHRFHSGDRPIGVCMAGAADQVIGFFADFATFYDTTDRTAPEVKALRDAGASYPHWTFDLDAPRADFDEVWRQGRQQVAERLGRPSVEGRHSGAGRWHAVWRVGSRLIVVAQTENFESYCVYDAAALWVVEHPLDAEIPTGADVYALFFEDQPRVADREFGA
jgi:hypothetical protein